MLIMKFNIYLYKYIIGDSCSNMSDSNPLKSIQPLFVQAIQDADINFNSELDSNTHRIDRN